MLYELLAPVMKHSTQGSDSGSLIGNIPPQSISEVSHELQSGGLHYVLIIWRFAG
jgi:hypothetical protein